MVGFVDDTVDGKQKSGEKATRDGDKTPCFPSGRNYQQNNWFILPTSTGFAEISEPSKYYFLFKQLPFSGDEFVDFPGGVMKFHLRSLRSTGLQKPTLGLPSVCWIWLIILLVYLCPYLFADLFFHLYVYIYTYIYVFFYFFIY